jgi:hypothetical protein
MRASHLKITVSLLALLLTFAVATAVALLSAKPLVPHPGVLTDGEVRQIERLIADNSPDRFRNHGERELNLDAEELTLLTAFLIANVPRLQKMAATFHLQQNTGQAWLSIPATLGPITLYLNLQADFEQQFERARLISLRAGKVRIPPRAIRLAEQQAGRRLATAPHVSRELADLRHNVNATALIDGKLHLHLSWAPESLSQLRSQAQHIFLGPDDRERILAYYTAISEIATDQAEERRVVSLQAFLPALFELAGQRSRHGDAIAENRSLLQALSLYVNALPVGQMIDNPPASDILSPPALIVTLHRRHDLGLHFVTAAAIAASAGANIAEVLAHSKEVYDARQRSGFSFSDMTANIAGVALGESGTSTDASARALQEMLALAKNETDYMPVPDTDADGLTEEMLAEAFGDRTTENYMGRIGQIEAKVAALTIYQQANLTDFSQP